MGLPKIVNEGEVCEICMKVKQNKENIAKQSLWKASHGLELVYSYICGLITVASESEKRFIINFIDDYSRKCWTFFLTEKSEAFLKLSKRSKLQLKENLENNWCV